MDRTTHPPVVTQLRELVDHVTYKPGVTLEIRDDVGPPALFVIVETTDTYQPGRPVRVAHRRPIPFADRDAPPDYLPRWLFDQLVDVERHEAAEWYRVDGVMLYDPHRLT